MERRGYLGVFGQIIYTESMAKCSRSSTEGPGEPDESKNEEGVLPDIIPVHPTIWRVRNAQREMKRGWNRSLLGYYKEQLDQTIERAVFGGDMSAIAHLQTEFQEFRVLQNAMQGDQQALATVADAFAELGRYDYASAFNILAGRGAWCWESIYRKKIDTQNRAQLLRRLRGIIPQSDKGTRKKND